MLRSPLRAAILASMAAACVSAGQSGPGVPRDRDLITVEELANVNVTNAYDAVIKLRPHFLRARGTQRSITGSDIGSRDVVVYTDGVRAGGPDVLRNMQVTEVESIRYLDASRATIEFGTGHLYGAIEVRTKGTARR